MLTMPIDTSQKNVNKAILEILTTIREKWDTSSLPIGTTPKDSYQTKIEAEKGHTDSQGEEIITETVLLRPEDFHIKSPSQEIPSNNIPEMGYEAPQTADEALKTETIEQAGEDVPETVIIDSNILKTEEASVTGNREEDVPETIIFRGKTDNDE